MEDVIITKRMFLLLSLLCMTPAILVILRGLILGTWYYIPLTTFLIAGSFACVLITFYFYRKKYLVKS